eukprot:scaffold20158_cov140-Skeletonema_menzelii.AAC.2
MGVVSSEFTCFGSQWRVKLYPGAVATQNHRINKRCSEGEGEGGRKLAMKYSLALDFAGQDHIALRSEDVFDYCDCAFGWLNFCALEQIIGSDNYLDEGRLTIQVDMKQ